VLDFSAKLSGIVAADLSNLAVWESVSVIDGN
jgi:hypothetical protein